MVFLTWYETEKAEIIEDILDEKEMEIEMLPTPSVIRDQDVMVCKDCFQVFVENEVADLTTLGFPANTKCFNGEGELQWEL
jgi:urease accessory protein UreE